MADINKQEILDIEQADTYRSNHEVEIGYAIRKLCSDLRDHAGKLEAIMMRENETTVEESVALAMKTKDLDLGLGKILYEFSEYQRFVGIMEGLEQ